MTLNPFKHLLVAWRDVRDYMKSRGRSDYLAAVAALAITAFIIFGFWHDSSFPMVDQVTYVENWPANRSDAEIEKDITADSVARHKAEAQRRAEFKQLADQFGIKTDK